MGKYKDKVLNYKEGIIGRLYHNLKWIYSFFSNYIGRIVAYVVVELLRLIVSSPIRWVQLWIMPWKKTSAKS